MTVGFPYIDLYHTDDNWTEFKKPVDKVDKPYEELS